MIKNYFVKLVMHLIWSPSILGFDCSSQHGDHVADDERTKQQILSNVIYSVDITEYPIHHLSSSYISSSREIYLSKLREVFASSSPLDSRWLNEKFPDVLE